MDGLVAARIRDAVSLERLQPYLDARPGDLAAAHRLYAWNIEVSAALYGPLHWLEIVMRNAMHRQLTEFFRCADWWAAPSIRLHQNALRDLTAAQDKLREQRKPVTPGRIVAELPFSFWVGLLGKGRDYEQQLWRPRLHRAFPSYHGKRSPLHHDLDAMRLLRNRIAHYEPIHRRHLAADYGTIMRLIGYISVEVADHVGRHDRVSAVLARRNQACNGSIPSSF
ncbi:MAG: hypothetical protein ACRDTE_25690 [Pseudonocardiaceae bacterium]